MRQADGMLSLFVQEAMLSRVEGRGLDLDHLPLSDPVRAALPIFMKQAFGFPNSTHLGTFLLTDHHLIEKFRHFLFLGSMLSYIRIIPLYTTKLRSRKD